MSFHQLLIVLICTVLSLSLQAQKDQDPPVAPVLDKVSVIPGTGSVEISWSRSSSSDVAGYVVYLFRENEGYEIDTITDPNTLNYLHLNSGAEYYSESYVVAALDTAGNISPLSNHLSTIFEVALLDSCKKKITITWNPYIPVPHSVEKQTLLGSINGAPFVEITEIPPDILTVDYSGFETDAQYCFIVKAYLEGGSVSNSNKTCLETKMQRPPDWINADYANITEDNSLMVSFTIDPKSELKNFFLEKSVNSNGPFTTIGAWTPGSSQIKVNNVKVSEVNYFRLVAMNNCSLPIAWSNLASNIVLSVQSDDNIIGLQWNQYLDWSGDNGGYNIAVNTGNGFRDLAVAGPSDTIFSINYESLMYEVTGDEICFRVKAFEINNPNGTNGESNSLISCIPGIEIISVPNLFTPDNNGLNDLFGPVLSFTPVRYRFIITNMNRKIMFESSDPLQRWDGNSEGSQSGAVYIWTLKVTTPSGREINRTGTVTIIR